MAQDALVDCSNAMTTVDMRYCAAQSLRAADDDLNGIYAQAIEAARETDRYLPEDAPSAEDLLRIAQRAWIPYRDAVCESAAAPYYGGSIQPQIHMSCLARMTRDRTQALADLMNGN